MCFKPKKPKVVEDPELKRQQEEAKAEAQRIRAENKQTATAEEIARQLGRIGRGSLISGSQGGAGFAMPSPRSLLAVAG